ncbi:PGPGW domain-containing protein [Luteococcus peritonei]|uniref:PGPGW domain-containing protein n=1 Tax=Luteococcus peritonei TaxID=88874 RepID=A0ABW4RV17_9ACTN
MHNERHQGEQVLDEPAGDGFPADLASDVEPRPHLLRTAQDGDRWAWRARIRSSPVALFWYRIGVGLVGGLLMVASVLTGWLPGPGGIPLFMLGLLVLSSEFSWAHGVMMWFKKWLDWFQNWPLPARRAFWTFVVVCILATWYAMAAWHGLPDWLPEALAAQLDRLPLVER